MKAGILTTALALLMLAACAAKEDDAGKPGVADAAQEATDEGESSASKISPQRELIDRNAAHPELLPSQKIGGTEGRSPFEGDRVIGLNAIVRRSLDTVREFEVKLPPIVAAVDAATKPGAGAVEIAAGNEGLQTIGALYDRAKSALDDMTLAETELRGSGEYFDESIFEGMIQFTRDVEIEIGEAKAELNAKLSG